jgi:hypothetical protein
MSHANKESEFDHVISKHCSLNWVLVTNAKKENR